MRAVHNCKSVEGLSLLIGLSGIQPPMTAHRGQSCVTSEDIGPSHCLIFFGIAYGSLAFCKDT